MTRGKKATIAVLGATFETPNMGVGALTAGTLNCIYHCWPEAEVFLFDYGREPREYSIRAAGRAVKVPLVNIRFSKKFYLANNIARLILTAVLARVVPSRTLSRRLVERNPWLKRLNEADVVAAISGGDSFSDIYGMRRLLYVSLPQILALVLGKDLVVLPQTLGPFKSGLARAIARYILGRAKLVYSRDHVGLERVPGELRLGGPTGKFRFCYDVGFVVSPIAPATPDLVGLTAARSADHCRVGLNISGLLAMGGYTRKNMFGLKADYHRLVRELIRFFIEKHRVEVLLVPHVFGTDAESDTSACEQVFEEFKTEFAGKLGIARGRYDQNEIKHLIGTCDFFVGSRMHACIAALSQNIPAVAIAYSNKFIGVLETVGMGSAVADPRKMSEAEIISLTESAFQQRDTIKRALEQTIPKVRETVLGLFTSLDTATPAEEIRTPAMAR